MSPRIDCTVQSVGMSQHPPTWLFACIQDKMANEKRKQRLMRRTSYFTSQSSKSSVSG